MLSQTQLLSKEDVIETRLKIGFELQDRKFDERVRVELQKMEGRLREKIKKRFKEKVIKDLLKEKLSKMEFSKEMQDVRDNYDFMEAKFENKLQPATKLLFEGMESRKADISTMNEELEKRDKHLAEQIDDIMKKLKDVEENAGSKKKKKQVAKSQKSSERGDSPDRVGDDGEDGGGDNEDEDDVDSDEDRARTKEMLDMLQKKLAE